MNRPVFRVFLISTLVLAAVGALAAPPKAGLLRLATTTSTADSGLLAFILPDFEKRFACSVDVVAVGTGQSLELGRRGDADVVLVHSRKGEDQFVADGFARERFDVMYNDFIVVGPKPDPARGDGRGKGPLPGGRGGGTALRQPRRQVRHARQGAGRVELPGSHPGP